jgi:hypothetical protein
MHVRRVRTAVSPHVQHAAAILTVVHPCSTQVELSNRLERERLAGSIAEADAARQRLSEQLAAAQQVRGGSGATP